MKLKTLLIQWHDKTPVLSLDFSSTHLATCGNDSNVMIWKVLPETVEFRAQLSRHTAPVNCVRFSPNDQLLASASDDATLILWKQSDHVTTSVGFEQESFNKETWKIFGLLRGAGSECYDIAWSPNSDRIVVGCVDSSVKVFCVNGKPPQTFSFHSHFCQGVSWDPLGQWVTSQSSDKTMNVYKVNEKTNGLSFYCRQSRMEVEGVKKGLFYDESMNSFFRRHCWSLDGAYLIAVGGCLEGNCVYLWPRNALNKGPTVIIPMPKPAVSVKCCPVVFEGSGLGLPYRMVFAVACLDSVWIFATDQTLPIGCVAQCHYATLTDLAWSKDGRVLLVSSNDGFCSMIVFEEEELGIVSAIQPSIPVAENEEKEIVEIPNIELRQPETPIVDLTKENIPIQITPLKKFEKKRIAPTFIGPL